jgi:hypothetical protein
MIAKNSFYLSKKFEIQFSEIETVNLQNEQNLRTTSSLSNEAAAEVVSAIVKKKDCTETIALLLITGVVQKGGTNKSAGSNTSFTCGDLSLNAQELQNIVSSVSKKGTNRQLARTLCNEIAQVALAANVEGDLANQMRYDHPDLSTTEAIWCSNFQTTNPDCPSKVREWLVNNYKSRFNR